LSTPGELTPRRLRALVCAHEFSPAHGSECAVGWNICTRLARYHDVTVLCGTGSQKDPYAYRNAYDEYVLQNGLVPGLMPVFVEASRYSRVCAGLNLALTGVKDGAGFRPLFYQALKEWQREAFKVAQRMGFHAFDLVHQLTPIGFRNPGFFWRSGLPFFWGPISGSYCLPLRFAASLGVRPLLFESFRALTNRIQSRSRQLRRVAGAAAVVWTVTHADTEMIQRLSSVEPRPMIECGGPEFPTQTSSLESTLPLRICWSGRHDSTKALPLLLQAIADPELHAKTQLNILGTGPETKAWKRLANSLRLSNIEWKGWLPREEALAEMSTSDLVAHTSVREATGVVVLEALALGKPVICHDACGMSLAVTDECGIKIPLRSPRESVRAFRAAIAMLIRDPSAILKLSLGAVCRASELTWDRKAKEIAEAYTEFVDHDNSANCARPRILAVDERLCKEVL
jgi:glycosyltransferase involved in cell wall biosynthesis